MSDQLVYLNGQFTPLSEAKIPVLDRGFIFGDGIYEVVPVYDRKPFRMQHHLARLFRSLEAIGIPNPHTLEEWHALIDRVSHANPAPTQLVYLQVTRGVAPRAHSFPKTPVPPTVFIMSNPFAPPPPATREHGVECVTMEDRRWLLCNIKSTSLLGNVLAAQNAVEHGVAESIQFRDDWLTEGSSSNVWIVKDGSVFAPPRDNLILEGIRYGFIEELCASQAIPFAARRIAREEVFAADEVILSSATKEVTPVVRIDGRAIGNGRPGPIFQKLAQAYDAAKLA